NGDPRRGGIGLTELDSLADSAFSGPVALDHAAADDSDLGLRELVRLREPTASEERNTQDGKKVGCNGLYCRGRSLVDFGRGPTIDGEKDGFVIHVAGGMIRGKGHLLDARQCGCGMKILLIKIGNLCLLRIGLLRQREFNAKHVERIEGGVNIGKEQKPLNHASRKLTKPKRRPPERQPARCGVSLLLARVIQALIPSAQPLDWHGQRAAWWQNQSQVPQTAP